MPWWTQFPHSLFFAALCLPFGHVCAFLLFAMRDLSFISWMLNVAISISQGNVKVVLGGLGRNVLTGKSDPGEAWWERLKSTLTSLVGGIYRVSQCSVPVRQPLMMTYPSSLSLHLPNSLSCVQVAVLCEPDHAPRGPKWVLADAADSVWHLLRSHVCHPGESSQGRGKAGAWTLIICMLVPNLNLNWDHHLSRETIYYFNRPSK